MASVNIAMRNADVLWVAPLLIFNAVRINTAVAGSHPKIPDAILAHHNQKTSRSLSKRFFVIFSAIFADMMVSSIAMMAITKAVINNSFTIKIPAVIFCIPRFGNGFCQSENARFGNLSERRSMLG